MGNDGNPARRGSNRPPIRFRVNAMLRLECAALLASVFFGAAGLQGAAAQSDPVGQANALLRAGKNQQAEAVLRSASQKNPDSASLHGTLGEVLLKEHNYEEAVQELGLAAQIEPDSRRWSMQLASALNGWGHFGVTADFLSAVQGRFGQYSEFHYNLGFAFYNLSRFPEARVQFEKALAIDPASDRARFLLASCLASERDFTKAVDILRHLAKGHPENALYWTEFGHILALAHTNDKEALAACKHALALKPNDAHIKFVTATVLIDSEDFAGARPILEDLEQLYPKVPDTHVALSRVYFKLGEKDLAQREAEIASRLQGEGAAVAPAPPVVEETPEGH